VQVKLYQRERELYVLVQSTGRQAKEIGPGAGQFPCTEWFGFGRPRADFYVLSKLPHVESLAGFAAARGHTMLEVAVSWHAAQELAAIEALLPPAQ